ncbi:MAG: hypothetical protein J1F17_06520 [Oscillospiraceae bacterium]|nr:hypothetical protein [Oscillospiraceae bacterium]
MLKNEIIIKGKSPELKLIKKLLQRCMESEVVLENQRAVLVLDKEIHMSADTENLAVPYHNKAYSGIDVLTYSQSDNRADVAALNLQSHQSTKSFELLYGIEMGRIYIDKNSEFDMYSVMCVAAALIAGKVPVKKAIEFLNSILS